MRAGRESAGGGSSSKTSSPAMAGFPLSRAARAPWNPRRGRAVLIRLRRVSEGQTPLAHEMPRLRRTAVNET